MGWVGVAAVLPLCLVRETLIGWGVPSEYCDDHVTTNHVPAYASRVHLGLKLAPVSRQFQRDRSFALDVHCKHHFAGSAPMNGRARFDLVAPQEAAEGIDSVPYAHAPLQLLELEQVLQLLVCEL